MTMIVIPGLITRRGLNTREHYMARARRVRHEKEFVGWELAKLREKPPVPCKVTLMRMAPSRGLDDDNLAGALKSVRDAVADWLGVDDRDRATVRYEYTQESGPWGVGIGFSSWGSP